jgi:hypothetical protein
LLTALGFVFAFSVLFVARVVLATVVFLWILPLGHECPICNAATVRVRHRGWNTLMPKFRTSWCPECGWEGVLQLGGAPPPTIGLVVDRRPPRATGRSHRRGAL